ncbi:MAG: HEAT repeat domain-containing protein [Gemmatimonadetes bacterium]|nr:HEAT repeat domain-containing protein [Gemmatimonadota bacterium]NNM33032.1 HEAT repeat domain-containing protein [Gemmatimonadota bacterium]
MSSLVAELVDALERGTDAFSRHPYESAEYREAHARLRALLEQAWSAGDRVDLPVGEGNVVGGPNSGLPGQEPPSFAQRLSNCGVTSVTLLPGAERREVVAFLQVVHRAARAESGESADLGSLLSQLGLQHIRCEFRELAFDPAAEAGPSSTGARSSPDAVRARIEADAASAPKPEIVDIESFDSTLHFLDESEIAYLKDEIEREYAQNLGKNVTALLMDTLESREDPLVRTEVIGVLEKLLPRLLQEGNFEAAVYLITEVDRAMQAGTQFDTLHRKALFALTAKLSSAQALGQLVQALEGAQGPPSSTELAALLANLTPRALGSVLKWLSRATTDTATLVSAAVEQVVAARPSALADALESSDTAVVAQALRLFRKSPSRESLPPVIELASSPDAAVRLQVVDALLAAGSARGCVVLTKLIEDEDAEVRTAALRAVAVRGWDKALAPIREAIEAKDIVGRGISEQRAFFEAYGTLAGTGGIEVLRPILLGRTRSAKKFPELRACAAVGLSQIEHPAARKLLLAAVKDRNPVVKAAASQALYG